MTRGPPPGIKHLLSSRRLPSPLFAANRPLVTFDNSSMFTPTGSNRGGRCFFDRKTKPSSAAPSIDVTKSLPATG
jgi:hypothetical protein